MSGFTYDPLIPCDGCGSKETAFVRFGPRENPRTIWEERSPDIHVAHLGDCVAVARKQGKGMRRGGSHSFVVEVNGVFVGVVPNLDRAGALLHTYATNKKSRCWPAPNERPFARNPKLMVLNPSSRDEALLAKTERAVGRRLSASERKNALAAIHEYRTFHGKDPEQLQPVDAPPGSPLFLSYIGHETRRDYVVKSDSERKGRWTHEAGDHGRKYKTKPAIIAAIPGRKKHNTVTVDPRGANHYFKPTHGLMG